MMADIKMTPINKSVTLDFRLTAINKPVNLNFGPVSTVHDNITVVTGEASSDYETLKNKPAIESVELVGDKKLTDFGVGLFSRQEVLDSVRKAFEY